MPIPRTTVFPGTPLTSSRLAYGCMRLGWNPAHPTPEALRRAAPIALDAAVECGFTLFDHADIYAGGLSEELFGAWLRDHPGLRDRLVLQSKCGIRPQQYDFSFAHIIAAVEGSLRRLGVAHLDLLLLHRPDPLGEPAEVARAFDQLTAQGKVRHFGVSNHNAGQIELLRRHVRQPLVVNQLELNPWQAALIAEGIHVNQARGEQVALATGILDHARLTGMVVQAWSPMGRAAMGSATDDAGAKQVRAIAQARGVAPETILIAWLLRHPAGIQPVIGSTTPERIRATAQALEVELTRDEWYAIFSAAQGCRMP